MYTDLASWWPVLSSPEEYADEAEQYRQALVGAARIPVREVLELGSGGGNNASHLKAHFELVLVDLSPAMLRVSRSLNPECEHVHGDMREVRLPRRFDAVFVQDAVSHILTDEDLARVFATAWHHLRPGGVALFCPDFTRETFRPYTSHGGHDRRLRGMRYLEWAHDPDPADTEYQTEMAYLLREGDEYRVVQDRSKMGLFPRGTWLDLLGGQGFEASAVQFPVADTDKGGSEGFLARRPGEE
ncbi:MAG: class I SAM-dependent methyltransferase [bacterium]